MDLDYGRKLPLHVTMLPNPSHLDAVDPVTTGKARGRQLTLKDGCYSDLPDRQMGDKVSAKYSKQSNKLFHLQALLKILFL